MTALFPLEKFVTSGFLPVLEMEGVDGRGLVSRLRLLLM